MTTAGPAILLETRDLCVRFGGIQAVAHVNLVIREGALHGIIGPNGAGKSTLIDAVSGFESVYSGSVTFGGEDITGLAPDVRARRGLSRTFQNLELYMELTVEENLRTASRVSKRGAGWYDEVIRDWDLGAELPRQVRHLSHGRRRIVSLARALMTGPRLLILDEPAAGLDTHETASLAQGLRSLVESGVSVALVDHDMALIMGQCDVVTVLEQGRILAEGTPGEIAADRRVQQAYLGVEP